MLDYTALMKAAVEEISMEFFRKLTNLSYVLTSDEVQDPEHFLAFLKSLKSLRSLELAHPNLNQEFYEKLPAAAHRITDIIIDEALFKKIDLNFRTKFNSLVSFQISFCNRV